MNESFCLYRQLDPLFNLATPLREAEHDTTSRKLLDQGEFALTAACTDTLETYKCPANLQTPGESQMTFIQAQCDIDCDTYYNNTSFNVLPNSSQSHSGVLLSAFGDGKDKMYIERNINEENQKQEEKIATSKISERKDFTHSINASMYISLKRANVDSLTKSVMTNESVKEAKPKLQIGDSIAEEIEGGERKSDQEQKSPQKSPVSGIPGWFGKGLAIKKRKKSFNS